MRIPSGTTDQYAYFYATDATDFTTPETGLSSFTVYRSRNGGAAAAFTSPTINETDSSNMPGVYELLLDEDMTIDSGDDEQEMVFHISHAGMAPVVRTITLFRPKITAGETLTVASGVGSANATQISGDATAADNAESFFDGTGYAGTNNVIPTVTTLTGHTPQTGDSFARLGAPDGASVSADIATVDANVDTLLTRITSTLFSGITSLAEWLGLIAGKQTGNSTARTEVRATGAGSGTFDETTDSIEAIRDRGDAEWTTGAGGSAPTVEEIRQEMDSNSTQLAAIVADTNELQGDWDDGGRLDLILDARASQASVDGLNDFDPANDTVANVTTVATTTNLTNLPTIPTDWIAAAGVAAGAVTKIQNGLSTLAIGDISGLEITELSSVPGASPTLEEALALLYMALRNKVDVTSSAKEIHNDAGTALGSKSLSDDGTTYSEAKLA